MKIKNTSKKIVRIAAVTLGIAFCSAPGLTAMAEDTQDKLDSANSAIQELRKEQGNISSEISDLNEKAAAAGDRINDLNDAIIHKQDDIDLVNTEIAGIEDDMSQRYEDMKLRIRYIYESGDMGLLESVMSSSELSDMLNRAEYIQKIYDYDRNELNIMAGLYNEHEEKLNTLENEVAELGSLKDNADAEARSLEALLTEKKDELKLSDEKLTQLEELAKKYEKQLEEERIAREEEERRRQEEAERKAKEEAEKKAAAEAAAKKAQEEAAKQTEAAKPQTTQAAAAPAQTAAPRATEAPAPTAAATPAPAASSNTSGSSYSQNDLTLMAAIIEVEAGDQCYEGRLAVGSVVMNRVESPKFPNTISGVIYQSGQFSPVASGRFAACLARGAAPTNVQAAKDVLGGVRNVPYLFFRMYNGYIGNYSSYTIIEDHILYNY